MSESAGQISSSILDDEEGFVWDAKLQAEGVDVATFRQQRRINKRAFDEARARELENIRKRRQERDQEMRARREEREWTERQAMVAAGAAGDVDWLGAEHSFAARQVVRRVLTRIKDHRDRAVDRIAIQGYLAALVPSDENAAAEALSRDAELRAAFDRFVDFSGTTDSADGVIEGMQRARDIEGLEQLQQDVAEQLDGALGRDSQLGGFWQRVRLLTDEAVNDVKLNMGFADAAPSVAVAAKSRREIERLLDEQERQGDALKALQDFAHEIDDTLNGEGDGAYVDIDYFEAAKTLCALREARVFLRNYAQQVRERRQKQVLAMRKRNLREMSGAVKLGQSDAIKKEVKSERSASEDKAEPVEARPADLVDYSLRPVQTTRKHFRPTAEGESQWRQLLRDAISPDAFDERMQLARSQALVRQARQRHRELVLAMSLPAHRQTGASLRQIHRMSNRLGPLGQAADDIYNIATRTELEEGEHLFQADEELARIDTQGGRIDDPAARMAVRRLHARKPRFLVRVRTAFDWNRYNQAHYDKDTPPPKVVVGYKFKLFYPDLLNPSVPPKYDVKVCKDDPDFCILRFRAGPPYLDVAFKIVNKEWDTHKKFGFEARFDRGMMQLNFKFMRTRYSR